MGFERLYISKNSPPSRCRTFAEHWAPSLLQSLPPYMCGPGHPAFCHDTACIFLNFYTCNHPVRIFQSLASRPQNKDSEIIHVLLWHMSELHSCVLFNDSIPSYTETETPQFG